MSTKKGLLKLTRVQTVITIGNSYGITVPSDLCDLLGVKQGDRIAVFKDEEEKYLMLLNAEKIRAGLRGFELSHSEELEKLLKDSNV